MVFSRPSIPTVKHQHSLLERRRLAADRVIATMRGPGQALHVSHERSGDIWRLSSGYRVPAEVAKLVVLNADVAGVGDTLFQNAIAQTFRIAK